MCRASVQCKVIYLKAAIVMTSTTDDLPFDVLVNIFSKFDLKKKVEAAQMCHRWKDIVYDKILWRDVKISVVYCTATDNRWNFDKWLDIMIPSLIQRHFEDAELKLNTLYY